MGLFVNYDAKAIAASEVATQKAMQRQMSKDPAALSDSQANNARNEYAKTDPRRIDQNAGDEKLLKSLSYPLQGGNKHYVRFYIHVNEESRLIKNKVVTTSGPVDNSNQNRSNKGTATTESISNMTAVGGAALGAQIASSWSSFALKKMFSAGNPMSSGYKVGAVGAAGALTAGGLIAGGALGYAAGPIATETFHLTNKLQKLESTITLYAPADIRTDYSMNYEITEDTLSALAQSDQSAAIMKGITSPGSWGKDISKIARIVGAKTKTASILSRTAVNPKKDIMFSSVNNRTFQFNYIFAPRSATEATEVANIIYMFKFFAHPEMLPGYADFLYLYPAEFEIEYGFRDENGTERVNENLNAISSCVLESISVNYAPNGSYQSLKNGEPIVTELSLTFKEIELLHQNRISQGKF